MGEWYITKFFFGTCIYVQSKFERKKNFSFHTKETKFQKKNS